MIKRMMILLTVLSFFGLLVVLTANRAQAIPSYARQTGTACNACHTVFPELTAFGRSFKMGGYTITSGQQIQASGSKQKSILEIHNIPQLSVMLQTSYSRSEKAQSGVQNNNVQFPQQLSLFYSGEITPFLGMFMQLTYEPGSGHFGWDNTEVRFAQQTSLGNSSLTYGATLNNNPTVQDVWNSTPAWGFPYASPEYPPTPAAATMVDGQLAQQVAGLGGYAFWNQMLYGEVSLYRSAFQGSDEPPSEVSNMAIKGVAPYWRLAWQHNFGSAYLELGTYGLQGDFYPTGISGKTDRYTDMALDAQLEMSGSQNSAALHSTFIRENRDLAASLDAGDAANSTEHLATFRADATYYLVRRYTYGFTLGYFSTTGSADANLYAADPVDGSRLSSPNSNGWIAQLQFMPFLNTTFILQYTAYQKFNGAMNNYDGYGRNASDNNALYALLWYAF